MRMIFNSIRFVLIFAVIITYLLNMALYMLFIRQRWRRVALVNVTLSRYCQFTLWLLRVRVNAIHSSARLETNALYVSNHLSYLDVLVICSEVPCSFVTSTEVRDSPGLGWICRSSGCVFVDRRNKRNIHGEVAELSDGLRSGINIGIFPEATSTNGEQIMRFRRPLFTAAIDAGKPVVPLCLNYTRVGGDFINRQTRDTVFWYGDMDFLPHLWSMVRNGGTEVDLHILPALPTQPADEAMDLALRSQTLVESVFQPVERQAEPVKP